MFQRLKINTLQKPREVQYRYNPDLDDLEEVFEGEGGSAEPAQQAPDPDAYGAYVGGWDCNTDFTSQEPYAPIVETVPIFGDDAAWLKAVWTNSGAVCVLQVNTLREVIINVPAYRTRPRLVGCDAARVNERQQDARINPFSKVKLRIVHFSDKLLVCSVCDNPGCDRTRQDAVTLESVVELGWHVHRDASAVLGELSPLCPCSEAAIDILWQDGVGSPTDSMVGDLTFCAWLHKQDPYSALLCTRLLAMIASQCPIILTTYASA